MTWMEYVDGMLDFLKSQIGPGHPLYRKKLYVSTVNRDRHTSETPWLDAVTLAADRHLTAG
jgi:hypothetical protein